MTSCNNCRKKPNTCNPNMTPLQRCSACNCQDGMTCMQFCKAYPLPGVDDLYTCMAKCPLFGQDCKNQCPAANIPLCTSTCTTQCTKNGTLDQTCFGNCVYACPQDPTCLKNCPVDCAAGCASIIKINPTIQSSIKFDKQQTRVWVYIILYFIFLVWAVILALKVSSGSERTKHLLFAVVFSPIYVLLYYIGMIK